MLTFALKCHPVMDLGLGKNSVFFKDTFCLSQKRCTNGQNIHNTLVYGHWDTLQDWCLLQFSWKCDGVKSKYCGALIVLAEIASAKVLNFVLALAVALAFASSTRNWDLYKRRLNIEQLTVTQRRQKMTMRDLGSSEKMINDERESIKKRNAFGANWWLIV